MLHNAARLSLSPPILPAREVHTGGIVTCTKVGQGPPQWLTPRPPSPARSGRTSHKPLYNNISYSTVMRAYVLTAGLRQLTSFPKPLMIIKVDKRAPEGAQTQEGNVSYGGSFSLVEGGFWNVGSEWLRPWMPVCMACKVTVYAFILNHR